MHTHYDNLKVSRKAPIEVIRASYKALAQKYHPDLNSGNAEALRIMTLLNLSYEVLSDPIKRASHDAWIAQSELPPVQNVQSAITNPVASAPVYTSSQNSSEITVASSPFGGFLRHLKLYWIFYLALCIWIWYVNIGIKLNDSSEMKCCCTAAEVERQETCIRQAFRFASGIFVAQNRILCIRIWNFGYAGFIYCDNWQHR